LTYVINTKRLAVGIAVVAAMAFGTMSGMASARDHRDYRGHWDRGRGYGQWNGGYYSEPPVVYAPPYYYEPPMVYGPGIGIYTPGLSVHIR
jgi:hypothetical protein